MLDNAIEEFPEVKREEIRSAYKELEGAHTSSSDVRAAAEVLESQLEQHSELPKDLTGLHDLCSPRGPNWIDDEGKFVWSEEAALFNFGKHSGKQLREIVYNDPDYLSWMAGADFPKEVRCIVSDALNGKFPEPAKDLQN